MKKDASAKSSPASVRSDGQDLRKSRLSPRLLIPINESHTRKLFLLNSFIGREKVEQAVLDDWQIRDGFSEKGKGDG
ncbi:hypothetical protein L0244_16755 [bacterium]|nr:hypothetical protein [bacterium]